MKKTPTKSGQEDDIEMRAEYDFSSGVRGKHYEEMQTGYIVTIHNPDGTTVVKQMEPRKGVVMLDPDVLAYFPDSASVNATLHSLIGLAPTKRKSKAKSATR